MPAVTDSLQQLVAVPPGQRRTAEAYQQICLLSSSSEGCVSQHNLISEVYLHRRRTYNQPSLWRANIAEMTSAAARVKAKEDAERFSRKDDTAKRKLSHTYKARLVTSQKNGAWSVVLHHGEITPCERSVYYFQRFGLICYCEMKCLQTRQKSAFLIPDCTLHLPNLKL